MNDDLRTFTSSRGDPHFDRAIQFVEAFRGAIADMLFDDAQDLAIAQSAACLFAGMIFGTMIVGGMVEERDKRRAGEVALNAFREGIKVGKRRAMRIVPTGGSA